MSNTNNIDLILYEELIRKRELEEEQSRQIHLEIPVYETNLEKESKKESNEPRRVIIIDL